MPPRFYASTQYLLPADEAETTRSVQHLLTRANAGLMIHNYERLNLQHRVIVRAVETRRTLAPLTLKAGDRVLESGAGSGKIGVSSSEI